MIQALTDNQDVFSAELRAQTSNISDLFQEARNQQAKTRDAIMRAIRQAGHSKSRHSQKQQESFLTPSWEYPRRLSKEIHDDDSDVHEGDFDRTKERKTDRMKTTSHEKDQEQQRMKAEAEFKHAILQSLRFPTMWNPRAVLAAGTFTDTSSRNSFPQARNDSFSISRAMANLRKDGSCGSAKH
jgi:hypothetical protein